jgi:methylisocitrate lyase
MGIADRALDVLIEKGSLESLLGEMQHRIDLYELLDYQSYNTFDSSVFNFNINR